MFEKVSKMSEKAVLTDYLTLRGIGIQGIVDYHFPYSRQQYTFNTL